MKTKYAILVVIMLFIAAYTTVTLLPKQAVYGGSVERITNCILTIEGTSDYAEIRFEGADIKYSKWEVDNRLSDSIFIGKNSILLDKSIINTKNGEFGQIPIELQLDIKNDVTVTITQQGTGYTAIGIDGTGTYTNENLDIAKRSEPVSFLIPATDFSIDGLNPTAVVFLGFFTLIGASVISILSSRRNVPDLPLISKSTTEPVKRFQKYSFTQLEARLMKHISMAQIKGRGGSILSLILTVILIALVIPIHITNTIQKIIKSRIKKYDGIYFTEDTSLFTMCHAAVIVLLIRIPLQVVKSVRILIENSIRWYQDQPISSKYILIALIWLSITPFLLIDEREDLAESTAIYAYYFLVLGVGSRLISVMSGEEKIKTIASKNPKAIHYLSVIPIVFAIFAIISLKAERMEIDDLVYIFWYWLILLSIFVIKTSKKVAVTDD